MALSLVPLGVALVLGPLLLPRKLEPSDVPLPTVDGRALENRMTRDDMLAEDARKEPLPADVRALGSAIRTFNRLQARDEPDLAILNEARSLLDHAYALALAREGGAALEKLRAAQLKVFLAEVDRFSATGASSDEMDEIAGAFVRRMRRAGWCRGHRLLLTEPELRVSFKMMWNGSVGGENLPELTPTLDELRVLYGLYFRLPHPTDASLSALELARRTAPTKEACEALGAGERLATESWRVDKLRKFAAIDPTYPAAYALGVALYRSGSFPASVASFRDWIEHHPEGPYALRARNYLKAAIDASLASP